MKKLLYVFCMLLFLCSSRAWGQSKINFANYQPDSVYAAARLHDKPVFMYATLKGCMPCKYLEYHVFSDSALAAFVTQRMVPVKLNVTDAFGKDEFKKRSAIAKELDVAGFPTILILDKNGQETNRIVGNVSAPQLLDLLKVML